MDIDQYGLGSEEHGQLSCSRSLAVVEEVVG